MSHQAVCATLSCNHSRIVQNLDDIYQHVGHTMVPFAEFRQQILSNESLKVLQADQKILANLFTDLTTYIELRLLKLKEQIKYCKFISFQRVDAKIEEVFKLIEKDDLVSLIDNQKGLQYLLEFSTSSTQDKILKAYIQRVQYIFGKVRVLFKELKLDTEVDSKKDLILEKFQQEKNQISKQEKPKVFAENKFKQNLNGDYEWNETKQDFVLKQIKKIDTIAFVKEIESKKNITKFIVDLRYKSRIQF